MKREELYYDLYIVCGKFLEDNRIDCEDACYQSDSVYENAGTLVEDIFTIFKQYDELPKELLK